MEDSYDDIISYHPLGQSNQGPIDYIEPKFTWSTNIATPSGRPSKINLTDNHQFPHLITSDEDYICTESPLPINTDIQPVAPHPTKDPTTDPSDETLLWRTPFHPYSQSCSQI